MATYPDLSPYEYMESDIRMVNIGWLGRESSYPTGPIDGKYRMELLRRAADPANLMRGMHDCEFCDEESPIEIGGVEDIPDQVWLGNGEIHVTGDDGVVYAAPTLIVHYIDRHGYSPPEQFLKALV